LETTTLLIVVGIVLALAFAAQAVTQGKRVQVIGAGLVVAALVGVLVYRYRGQLQETRELASRRAEFQSRIAQFAAKYKAVTDWQKALAEQQSRGRLYTVELQPVLVRPDQRPVMVFATLRNLAETDGHTLAYFDESNVLDSAVRLELECPQVRSLASDRSTFGFEVIAQIRSVESIEAGEYSLAKGRCVDVMPVSTSDYLELMVGPELAKHGS
jgi:hypothetical protein